MFQVKIVSPQPASGAVKTFDVITVEGDEVSKEQASRNMFVIVSRYQELIGDAAHTHVRTVDDIRMMLCIINATNYPSCNGDRW